MSRIKPWLWWLAVVAAVLVRHAGALLRGEVFWFHDLRHHHLPWRAWAAGRWSRGEVPLWSADVGAGFPLAADGQVGVFYPPNALFGLVFEPERALTSSIVAHELWAAAGAYWLFRRLGRSAAASALGALGWALSGFLVARTTYAGLHAVAAWMPWLCGAALVMARAPTGSGAFGLAICVAASLTAGHPQMAAIALIAALWVALAQRPRRPLPGLGAALAGVVVASPQVFASLELAAQSARKGGVDADFAAMGGLPPQEIVNLALPRFWGWQRPADLPLTYIHKTAAYFGTGENHWENCIYLGFPILLLAISACRERRERPWLWLGAFGGLLMLGSATPLWPLLHHIPGLDFFRFPVRFSALLVLAILALATGGLDRVLGDAEVGRALSRRALGAVVVLLGGGLCAYAALQALREPAEAALLGALGGRPDGPERVRAVLDGMAWNGSLGLLAPAASLLALGALARRWPRWIVALVGLDLVATLWGYNPSTPLGQARAAPAALEHMDRGESLYRTTVVDRVQPPALDGELLSASLGVLWGTHDVIVLSPLRLPEHEALLAKAGLDVGLDHGPTKAVDLVNNLEISRILGLRTLLSVHALEHPELALLQASPVRVYRDPGAFPRAWVVGCAREAAADPVAQLSGLDLRQEVVLDGAPPIPCAPGGGEAEVLSYADEAVELRARGPGLLVLADTLYPGWEARIDGVPAQILRANGSLRGLVLPEGEHRVRFEYAPRWRPLVWVCGAGWVMLIAGGLVLARRDSRVAVSAPGPR